MSGGFCFNTQKISIFIIQIFSVENNNQSPHGDFAFNTARKEKNLMQRIT
jgi:hypothetical protein